MVLIGVVKVQENGQMLVVVANNSEACCRNSAGSHVFKIPVTYNDLDNDLKKGPKSCKISDSPSFWLLCVLVVYSSHIEEQIFTGFVSELKKLVLWRCPLLAKSKKNLRILI